MSVHRIDGTQHSPCIHLFTGRLFKDGYYSLYAPRRFRDHYALDYLRDRRHKHRFLGACEMHLVFHLPWMAMYKEIFLPAVGAYATAPKQQRIANSLMILH